jgi:hypothetical protein
MARYPSPDSVSSRVAEMKIDETLIFLNPYTSVMVMVSLLRRKKDHAHKIFKIKYTNEKTAVTRYK